MEGYIHKQIHDELLNAQNPVFICDERIDGDTLGAALAFADFMVCSGKPRPSVYVADVIPEVYQNMPHIDACSNNYSVFEAKGIDLVVVFDCSDELYVESLVKRIKSRPKVINIDHHKTNTRYGHINQVIDTAPAASEVVYRFFEHNNIVPSKSAATCILTGLCFDTTMFSNSATNERVLQVASELILLGARVKDVLRTMFKNRSIAALRVWGSALERLHHNPEFNCIITCLTRKDIDENSVTDDEIDGLTNFLSLVTDTDSLYVLRETSENGVKVSMRSTARDVSIIAREKGGGGHQRAAGYTIRDARLVCGDNGIWKVENTAKVK